MCLQQFEWLGFVKAVVEAKGDPERSISSSEPVIVRVPQYFKELFKLINSTDPRYTDTHTQTEQHSGPRAPVAHYKYIIMFNEITCSRLINVPLSPGL